MSARGVWGDNMAKELMNRLMAKVRKQSGPLDTECWIWHGCKDQSGYGRIQRDGLPRRTTGAHRAIWELHNEPLAPNAALCHRCDTPSCVNPDHLFIGTDRQNQNDRLAKGRGVIVDGKAASSPEFAGTTWHKRHERWQAGTWNKDRYVWLGYFVDRAQAAIIVREYRRLAGLDPWPMASACPHCGKSPEAMRPFDKPTAEEAKRIDKAAGVAGGA